MCRFLQLPASQSIDCASAKIVETPRPPGISTARGTWESDTKLRITVESRKNPEGFGPRVNKFRNTREAQLVVLVIGGAGYIGSHTARALRRAGHEVIIFDNLSTGYERLAAGFELIKGDMLDGA